MFQKQSPRAQKEIEKSNWEFKQFQQFPLSITHLGLLYLYCGFNCLVCMLFTYYYNIFIYIICLEIKYVIFSSFVKYPHYFSFYIILFRELLHNAIGDFRLKENAIIISIRM